MDLKVYGSAAKLLSRVLDRSSRTLPLIAAHPEKPVCTAVPASLPRCAPEERGIRSETLGAFFAAVDRSPSINPHGLTVLADGYVIGERTWGAFRRDVPMTTYSECKSITGLAIGMCVDDGLLSVDDRVIDILRDGSLLSQLAHKTLTVRHLLTMTSGVSFAEPGSVTETDWQRCFLDSFSVFEPGSSFLYNSMNSYMLSAIVTKVTGLSMFAFLRERLFAPLGITSAAWESCPLGITKGGWGLYIAPEDLAKIALLVMNGGVWQGRRLISKEWIDAATSPQVVTPEGFDRYSYGYQIWVNKHCNSYIFNGMFGQNVFCYPESSIIVVANAGAGDFFQQSDIFPLCDDFFAGLRREALPPPLPAPEPMPAPAPEPEPDPGFWRRLLSRFRRPRAPVETPPAPEEAAEEEPPLPALPPLPAEALALCGRRYAVPEKDGAALGLLPLILQVVQNNYASGLRAVSFREAEGVFVVVFHELEEEHAFRVGFDAPAYTDLTFGGEPYRVGVLGRCTQNEDGVPVLVLRIDFIETASTRTVKFFTQGETLRMVLGETPGKGFALRSLGSAKKIAGKLPALGSLLLGSDTDYLEYKIDRVFSPGLTLTPEEL